MPGIVNLPSARVTASYAVPDGPCTATRRAASSGAPEESVTTPAIAAVVTPWAPSAVVPAKPTAARSREILQGGLMLIPQNRFIGWISRDLKGLSGRAQTCGAPITPVNPGVGHESVTRGAVRPASEWGQRCSDGSTAARPSPISGWGTFGGVASLNLPL